MPLDRLEAEALAAVVARNTPLVVRASEAMVRVAAHRVADALFAPLSQTDDAREGFRPRAERRLPRWKGR